MVVALPLAMVLIADKGYDSDHIRQTIEEGGGAPDIPDRENRKQPIPDDGFIHALHNQIAQLQQTQMRRQAGGSTRENHRKLPRIHPNCINTTIVSQLGSTSQTVVLKRSKPTA